MKQYFLATFALLFVLNLQAEPPKVEAKIYSETQVNRFRRKDHPAKFGECWGRDTEIYSEDFKNIVESTDTKGHVTRSENRGHSQITNFYFGAMDWNIEMGPEDILRFSFTQDTKRSESDKTERTCNTTITTSHVLSQKSTVEGKLLIAVPTNTYVLRVRNVEQKSNVNISSFETSYEILNRQTATFKNVTLPVFQNTQYLFVRPGDLVRVNMKFTTDSIEKVDFNIGYEVGFLGSYRCENIIKEGAVKTAKEIISTMTTPESLKTADLDDLFVKSSCLRNPLVTRELFMSSHGSDLVSVLRLLANAKFTENLAKNSARVQSLIAFNTRLLTMELAQNLLEDLYVFCEPTELQNYFDVPSEFTVLTRRYHTAAINYLKIKYAVDRSISPVLQEFVSYLSTQEQQAASYAQLNQPNNLKLLNAYAENVLSDDLVNYSNLLRLLDVANTQAGTEIRERLRARLNEANKIGTQLSYDFQLIFRAIGQKKSERVTARQIKDQVSRLEILNNEILLLIQKDLNWFAIRNNNPADSLFTEDLYDLNSNIMMALAQEIAVDIQNDNALKEALLEANPNLQAIFNFSTIQSLHKKVNQCLSTAKD